MPLRLNRQDLDCATQALLTAAKTAKSADGHSVHLPGATWAMAERHICAAIALMSPGLDTAIPEDVEFFSLASMPRFPRLRGKTTGDVTEIVAD